MKILQINSHYNQGGAARIVACIHRQLLADGEDSYVAFGRGKKPEPAKADIEDKVERKAFSTSEVKSYKEDIADKNVFKFGKSPEIYLSALISRAAGINGWSNRLATKRLIMLIDRIGPDLIHMHALHGYYLNLPLLFAYINKRNIPCVWTFHDCHAFVGNCGYFFECNKWKTGCSSCPDIRRYPKSQWLDFTGWMWKQKKQMFTAGSKKVIVTPSEWLTGEAKKSFFGKYKCITIRNGIDGKNTFYPRDKVKCREKYGFGAAEKLILGIAAGYDDERKGAKYIIQLAKNLEKEAKVILVGWNEKNNKMLEGTSNIITRPNTPDTQTLAEYYSCADVFVLPSLAENYATVSLESMACGTPVVGFDAGGIPEQLEDGRGIAVPVGNQEEFDKGVRKALGEDSGLLRGEALAARIRQENSTEKMTWEYLQVYQELLGRKEVK